MTSRHIPGAPGDEEPVEGTATADDAFAGLTAIDVVEGELIPRGRRLG